MKTQKALEDRRIRDFTDNFNSFYSLIFSAILSKIKNFHDAEDICQEVFSRFYHKLEEIENPRKWLFGALRIVVLDYYKSKHKNRDQVDIETIFDNIAVSYVNGFKDTRLVIENALEKIFDADENEKDKALFELVAIFNYTYQEAADHLNLSYKQVRTRFGKIMKLLLHHLKEMGINSLEELL